MSHACNLPLRNWFLVLVLCGCTAPVERGARSVSEPVEAEPTPATHAQPTALNELDQLAERYAAARATRIMRGKATYYADSLAGHRTASGEPYDPNRAQAAHRTLPFGTIVRVTSLNSNRSIVVRIVDRGPFGGKGRIIDLSYAAAERLGIIRAGVAEVRIEVLEVPARTR
jgi:rare lipoprotein A